MPQNARRSLGGNATISETDTSRTSATSTKSAIRRRIKLRLLCRSENWMAALQRATEKQAAASSSSISQWRTSQWQTSWNSRQPASSEKRWWFLFPGKNSRVQKGHPFTIHICAVQFVHKRGTHITRLAQVTRIAVIFALQKSLVVWWCTCLTLIGCLTCRLPRAHHLPHSLFLLRHKNTQHNRYNMNNSENTQYITHISKLPRSTSCAINNHSGVKTCRAAETRARQIPQVTSPKNLWPFRESKHILESIHRRTVYSLLTNCSEMFVFGSCWETRYFVFCEQTCSCGHNGQFFVTNAWRVWSRTFIVQVNSDNLVLWETQHNSADLDCFKTLILQETLKTQNQHQEESCPFSEVTRLCQEVWCARNRLQFVHSSTEAEIISLDAGSRMDCIPALTLWDLVIEVFIPYRTEQMDPIERERALEKPVGRLLSQTCTTPFQ